MKKIYIYINLNEKSLNAEHLQH